MVIVVMVIVLMARCDDGQHQVVGMTNALVSHCSIGNA